MKGTKRYSRRRSTRRRQQRGRGTNLANVVPQRFTVTNTAPLYAIQGSTNLNTRRRTLRNNAAASQVLGQFVGLNFGAPAQVNTVHNYKSPVRRGVTSMNRAASALTPVALSSPKRLSLELSELPESVTATKWSMLQAHQQPGSRHLV